MKIFHFVVVVALHGIEQKSMIEIESVVVKMFERHSMSHIEMLHELVELHDIIVELLLIFSRMLNKQERLFLRSIVN